jgi:Mrp family chromosome partitioning ATPase
LSADLRSPSLHEYFATKFDDGLVRALLGERDLTRAIRAISLNGSGSTRKPQDRDRAAPEGGSLALLGTTQRIRDPAAVLQSDSMAKLLASAKESFDTIVIDAPPMLAGAEAHLLAQFADALVLVSRIGKLTRNDVRRAVRTMEATELSAVGLVVTGRPVADDGYGYGYGYGYAADANREKAASSA